MGWLNNLASFSAKIVFNSRLKRAQKKFSFRSFVSKIMIQIIKRAKKQNKDIFEKIKAVIRILQHCDFFLIYKQDGQNRLMDEITIFRFEFLGIHPINWASIIYNMVNKKQTDHGFSKGRKISIFFRINDLFFCLSTWQISKIK